MSTLTALERGWRTRLLGAVCWLSRRRDADIVQTNATLRSLFAMVRTSLFVAAAAAMALPVAIADMRPERRQAESSSTRRHRSSDSAAATATSGSGSGSGGAAAASPSAFTGSLPASISSIVATLTPGTRSVEPTYPLPTTFQAGATNTYISGAPPLPTGECAPVTSGFRWREAHT